MAAELNWYAFSTVSNIVRMYASGISRHFREVLQSMTIDMPQSLEQKYVSKRDLHGKGRILVENGVFVLWFEMNY